MAISVLVASIALQQFSWKPPYEVVKTQVDAVQIAKRLGSRSFGVYVEGDRLTILGQGKENPVRLPDWMIAPFTPIPNCDIWITQANMPNWNEAFFTFGLMKNGKRITQTFRGTKAPKAPVEAKQLRGTMQTIPFESKSLAMTRNLFVYLPPNAPGNLNAIYMADGQICKTYARLLEPLILSHKVAPTAIIGLDSGKYMGDPKKPFDINNDLRSREYLRVMDPERFDLHLRFVCDEVMPWAEKRFHLAPTSPHRAVFGFSNGAAFALVASIERPDTFGASLCYSVAAFDRKYLRETVPTKHLPPVWFVSGTLESFTRNTSDAQEILMQAGQTAHFEHYVTGHDELMWELAFAKDIPLIFPGIRD